MADKVKVVLNGAGVRELLQSQEILDACLDLAEQIASQCGDGYEVSQFVGKNRVNASVYADTAEAQRDNFENDTLLNALGGI